MSYGLISRRGLRARAQALRDLVPRDFAAVPRLVPQNPAALLYEIQLPNCGAIRRANLNNAGESGHRKAPHDTQITQHAAGGARRCVSGGAPLSYRFYPNAAEVPRPRHIPNFKCGRRRSAILFRAKRLRHPIRTSEGYR
jgi:hypothetical protein